MKPSVRGFAEALGRRLRGRGDGRGRGRGMGSLPSAELAIARARLQQEVRLGIFLSSGACRETEARGGAAGSGLR